MHELAAPQVQFSSNFLFLILQLLKLAPLKQNLLNLT